MTADEKYRPPMFTKQPCHPNGFGAGEVNAIAGAFPLDRLGFRGRGAGHEPKKVVLERSGRIAAQIGVNPAHECAFVVTVMVGIHGRQRGDQVSAFLA